MRVIGYGYGNSLAEYILICSVRTYFYYNFRCLQ